MQVKFYNKKDLSNEDCKQIRNLWGKAFDKLEDDMNLIDETTVSLLRNDSQELVGMAFLLNPTKTNLESEILHFKNIKDQGVTENHCYIYNFCITRSEHRKGFGKYLLSECHKYICNLEKNKVMLFVEDGNIPAICLYIKAGYLVHRSGLSGFVMKKNLQ